MDPQRVMLCQLVPARVRPYRVHFPEPANPPQPVRLQGRHQQPQDRRHRAADGARLGRGSLPPGGSLDAGRQLPGGAPDPDADRNLGPHVAAGTGTADRADKIRRRVALRRQGIHRPGLHHQGQGRRTPDGHGVACPARPRGPERRRADAPPGRSAATLASGNQQPTGWRRGPGPREPRRPRRWD